MTLLPDWKEVLTKAWSVRFIALAAVLSGVEVVVSVLQPTMADDMPPGVFAALAGLVTAAALVARVLAQSEVKDADQP